jgi:hypothetical protein
MAGERPEYRVLRPIPDPVNLGRTAYLPGEGILLQVVEDWGLTVGEDVEPARKDSIPRPAGNASRADWAKYALIQGLPAEEVDGLTRDQLRDHPALTDQPADKPSEQPAEQPAVAEGE